VVCSSLKGMYLLVRAGGLITLMGCKVLSEDIIISLKKLFKTSIYTIDLLVGWCWLVGVGWLVG
jgi:hypothetical protein